MASAAAVAANEANTPPENDLGADLGYVGEITSGIYPKDEPLPDEDDDDDLPSNPLKGRRANRAVNGDADGDGDGGDPLNLFGDDEEEGGDKG